MAIVENYTEPIEQHPATGFDVDAWLQDAHMPEESAEVYKRADVVGELTALRGKIELERKAADSLERTAGESDTLTELEQKYAELVDTFAASQLTIYTRALSSDEKRTVREASDKRTEGKDPKEQNQDFGYELLAKSIIAVRPFDGERTPVSWDHSTIRALENKIGPAQMSAVLQAHQLAQNRMPIVDADFLRKPSGEGTGQD